MLDAAKGNAWIRSDHPIDERQPRLNLIDEQLALRRIVRPRARSKTKDGVVGYLNRFCHVFCAIERRHGAKQLIVKRRRIFGNIRQRRGRKEISLAVQPLSSQQDEPPQPLPIASAEPVHGASILERVQQNKQREETEAILAALTTAHWNRKHAATLLNLEYKAFLYKMKKLGIESKPTAAKTA